MLYTDSCVTGNLALDNYNREVQCSDSNTHIASCNENTPKWLTIIIIVQFSAVIPTHTLHLAMRIIPSG